MLTVCSSKVLKNALRIGLVAATTWECVFELGAEASLSRGLAVHYLRVSRVRRMTTRVGWCGPIATNLTGPRLSNCGRHASPVPGEAACTAW